jgi:hypothetical protein
MRIEQKPGRRAAIQSARQKSLSRLLYVNLIQECLGLRATEKFKMGVVAATGGIAVFGVEIPRKGFAI